MYPWPSPAIGFMISCRCKEKIDGERHLVRWYPKWIPCEYAAFTVKNKGEDDGSIQIGFGI